MGKKDKLIQKLKTIPKDFTFDEMLSLLEYLGFSVIKFYKGDMVIILHKPHPRKELLEYQLKQILDILMKEGLI